MSKPFARASDYPLHWPEMFPRAKKPTSSKFNTSLFNALENVKEALRKFAVDSGKSVTDLTISSNYSLTDTKPKDAGVAVWIIREEDHTDHMVTPSTIGQFTGLFDKNGVEIYEGDRVRGDYRDGEVVFLSGCFCVKYFNGDTNLIAKNNFFEVTGNIHQPEQEG